MATNLDQPRKPEPIDRLELTFAAVELVKNGVTREDGNYNRVIVDRYPHATRFEDAVTVLRKALGSQPDNSVSIVQVGFSTNLALQLSEQK